MIIIQETKNIEQSKIPQYCGKKLKIKFRFLKLLVFSFSVFSSIAAISQKPVTNRVDSTGKPDTVLMNNGTTMITHVIDTFGLTVQMMQPHSRKHKEIEIDKEDIFQITYGNTGKRVILYKYDTLVGHDFTLNEAKLFIAGEQDAQHHYHALGSSVAAFVLGFGSGMTGSLFSLVPPFVFAGGMSLTHVRINPRSVRNKENITHEGYRHGYTLVARRKRTVRSLLWGGIGLALGTLLYYILANN